MDGDNELARAKWLLISGLLFIVSLFLCYAEVVYLLNGRETQANVTKTYEVTKRGRFGISRGTNRVVEYAFAEPDGTRRTDSDTVSADTDIGQKVAVRYTPGANGRSRLAGHVNWFGVILFSGSILSMTFFGFRIWREYKAGEAPRKRR